MIQGVARTINFVRRNVQMLLVFLMGVGFGLLSCRLGDRITADSMTVSSGDADMMTGRSIAVPMEAFPEPQWRTAQTLDARIVTSTPFARFEIHKVKTDNGQIINDWLWTDERSHVNILVHLKDENKYLVFRQKKYGLKEEKIALVGGLFNNGETSVDCAHRELLEETGLKAEEMIELGAYRVQVNRGGGILHAYLARNCVKSTEHLGKFEADYESQKPLKLTRDELLQQIMEGNVGEAQWLGVASTALLYEYYRTKTGEMGVTSDQVK